MSQSIIRNVCSGDLDRCFEIESVAYAGDESASRDKIRKRIETWPEGFIVLERDGVVEGFINSGAAFNVELSDEDFKALIGHDPAGPHVVIMSVAVHPDAQRQGLAGQLMAEFIARMRGMEKQSIHLICRTALIEMYARYGFEYQGESESNYGGLSWHEMILTL